MNGPEWLIILIGCIASIAAGATQPIFAILLAKIVNVSHSVICSQRRRDPEEPERSIFVRNICTPRNI
jgi:hypothetical protein